MTISHFKDFKGKLQTQYDRDEGDTDEEMLAQVKFPNRVAVLFDYGRSYIQTNLRNYMSKLSGAYKIVSLVNYKDLQYTSVIVEKRNKA